MAKKRTNRYVGNDPDSMSLMTSHPDGRGQGLTFNPRNPGRAATPPTDQDPDKRQDERPKQRRKKRKKRTRPSTCISNFAGALDVETGNLGDRDPTLRTGQHVTILRCTDFPDLAGRKMLVAGPGHLIAEDGTEVRGEIGVDIIVAPLDTSRIAQAKTERVEYTPLSSWPQYRIADWTVYVASNSRMAAQGLQFLPGSHFGDNDLVLFPNVQPGSRFHTRNCTFPLDIAFLDDQFRVLAINQVMPEDETADAPEGTHHALEAKLGWFEAKGVREGDVVLKGKGRSNRQLPGGGNSVIRQTALNDDQITELVESQTKYLLDELRGSVRRYSWHRPYPGIPYALKKGFDIWLANLGRQFRRGVPQTVVTEVLDRIRNLTGLDLRGINLPMERWELVAETQNTGVPAQWLQGPSTRAEQIANSLAQSIITFLYSPEEGASLDVDSLIRPDRENIKQAFDSWLSNIAPNLFPEVLDDPRLLEGVIDETSRILGFDLTGITEDYYAYPTEDDDEGMNPLYDLRQIRENFRDYLQYENKTPSQVAAGLEAFIDACIEGERKAMGYVDEWDAMWESFEYWRRIYLRPELANDDQWLSGVLQALKRRGKYDLTGSKWERPYSPEDPEEEPDLFDSGGGTATVGPDDTPSLDWSEFERQMEEPSPEEQLTEQDILDELARLQRKQRETGNLTAEEQKRFDDLREMLQRR